MNIVAVYRKLMARRGPPIRASLAAVAVVLVALTSLATPLAAGAAPGNEVPFNGSLEGFETASVVPPVAYILGEWTGNATHLGRFTVENPHTVNLITRDGVGTFVFTAANGDTVTTDESGHAEVVSGIPPTAVLSIVEHARITGGTGRFAGATGRFSVERILNQATGVTTGAFDGAMSSPAGNSH